MIVRAVLPDEAATLRELRREALRDTPEAFAVTFEEEDPRDAAWYAERLRASDGSFVAGAFDDGELVGMAGMYREAHRKMRHKAVVWGMYVRPSARGKGVGEALLRFVVDRARTVPELEQLQLCVATACAPAARLYERVGFVTFGLERRALVLDGHATDELHMALELRATRSPSS